MKLIQANPVVSGAVPLLLAVAIFGCQSTGEQKGRAENQPATGSAGDLTAKDSSIPEATEGAAVPGSAEPAIPEQTFDLDPALLGFGYQDSTLGIRFSPPRSWPPLEPGQMEQTKQAYEKLSAGQQGDQFVSKPVRMFCEKDKRYFMILSDFTAWPVPLNPIAEMEVYRQRVAARNPGSILHYGMTRHGKLVLFQMLITNQIIANARVIVIREGRVPIQVDYLVPQQVYADVARAIDASIGSIQPL